MNSYGKCDETNRVFAQCRLSLLTHRLCWYATHVHVTVITIWLDIYAPLWTRTQLYKYIIIW